MKSKIASLRSVKPPCFIVALAGLALAVSPPVRASLVVYEGFNYADQIDNAALAAAAFNGGTGLAGNWLGNGKYRSAGLTFSDLAVTGGCAQNSNSQIYYRPLNVNKTGTLWGSFLFKSVGVVDASTTLLSYIVNSQAGGNDWQSTTKFGVTPKRYQGTNGDIRLGGTGSNPTALNNSGGTSVTQGTTYLILFKVENLIASGGAAASQTITSWMLSVAQYDNFKSGGLTEAELNAAVQGSAATNVMQKTTLTATQKASFLVTDFLTVQSNNAGDFMNDEFRFSDASLAEVAPTGAPSADIYTFGPGATIGPVAANAAAISWTVPFGTNVTTLAPTYTLSPGATCTNASGSTQDFSSPVHYIVQASDFGTSGITTDYTVTATVAPDETTLLWNVAGNGSWDLTTPNWKGQLSGVTLPFANGQNVIFDKTSGGTITLASGISPASTTVSATSGTYAFSGLLGGTGSLTKSNGGSLNLDGANTYTGGTLISSGVVNCSLQNPSPLGGAGSVDVTVQSGGTLALNRNQITGNLTLNGGKVAVSNGWSDDAWNGPVALSGNSTIDVGSTGGALAFNGIVSGTGSLIKLGTSNRATTLNAANTFSGNLTISQGAIALGAAGSIDDVALISIAAGATFDVSAKSAYSFTSSNSLSASGNTTAAQLKGASTGTVDLSSSPVTLTYNALNPALTVTQGTLVLNGNPFTVNTASALAVGTYTIATQTTGSITSSGTYPGVTGTAIGAGKVGAISVSGSNVLLSISVPTLEVAAFPSSQVAGVADSVTVTVKNGAGETATGYTGTVTFSSSDGAASLPANYTFVPADNGTHTFTSGVTLKTVAGGTKSITATAVGTPAITGTQLGIDVTPAAAATLAVSGFPASKTAGAADNVTITAKDAYNNVATGYTGTIHLTSTDVAAVLPANYTFVGGDNGTKALSVRLNTVSGATVAITAMDTMTGTIAGTQSGIIVLPSTSAAVLQVTGFPSSTTAGVAGNVTITAKTSGGATATGYTGTVHFTSTDGSATLPSNYTFVAGDNGVHTFTGGVTLTTAAGGVKSITASDVTTFITGTESDITVNPATAATLMVSGYPSPQFVGTAGDVTVTAKDAYNNTATGYTGTVNFTSTDGVATLPSNYTFGGGDSGMHTFTGGVTFATAGTQGITAMDTMMGAISGTQSGITVNQVPANFSWVNAGGGFWAEAANWTNNSGISYVPDTAGKSNYVLNFNQAGTYTTNHNLGNGFLLNRLNFGGAAVTLAGLNLALINDGAILPQINQNGTIGVTVNNSVDLGADTTVGGSGNGSVALNGLLSGSGSLTKTTSGSLGIYGSSPNTYSGGTIITAGTISLAPHMNAPLGTGPVSITNATLDFNASGLANAMTLSNAILYSSNGFAGNFSGPVTLTGNNTLDTGSTGNNAITGDISGAGGLTKLGTQGWPLSGSNTFTGNITISAGSLTISGSGYLGGGSYAGSITNNASFLYSSMADQTLSGVISGSGSLTKNAASTLTLTAVNSYTGATTISGGALVIGGAGKLNDGSYAAAITNNGSFTYGSTAAQTLSGVISGSGSLTKASTSTLTLTAVNSYAGATTISDGTLLIGGAGQLAAGTYAGDIALDASTASLTYSSSAAQTLSGTISGTGSLTHTGTGTLTLATNTYSGDTTVSGGILAVNGSSLSDTGKLTINTGGMIEATGTETVDTLYFGATPKVAGTWGATGSGATNIDNVHFVGTAGMVLVTTGSAVVSDFNAWANDYLSADVSNPAADTDGDGLNNQQEYAFGLNPTLASSVNPITAQLNKTTGMFSYTRRATPATSGITYTVLTSTNMVTWTPDAGSAETSVTNGAGTVQTVTFTVSNPAANGKLFVRVKAVPTPVP